MFLWTAFLLGLGGSLHCAGMCGPIALALPRGFPGRAELLLSRINYNIGRVFTYSLLGAVWGLAGRGFALAGMQRGLSVAMGILVIMMTLFAARSGRQIFSWPFFERMMGRLRSALGRLLGRPAQGATLGIGMLNGLLPCGMVYLALAGAIAAGNVLDGMAYMAVFGLGTFPLMMLVALAGARLSPALGRNFRHMLSILALLFGVLLILRGLALGIPYISPLPDAADCG